MAIKCAICDDLGVTESLENEKLTYGCGEDRVLLDVELVVLSCGSCGEAYTDYRGEEAREAAITEYLAGKNNKSS
jgi:hypothetical protein